MAKMSADKGLQGYPGQEEDTQMHILQVAGDKGKMLGSEGQEAKPWYWGFSAEPQQLHLDIGAWWWLVP